MNFKISILAITFFLNPLPLFSNEEDCLISVKDSIYSIAVLAEKLNYSEPSIKSGPYGYYQTGDRSVKIQRNGGSSFVLIDSNSEVNFISEVKYCDTQIELITGSLTSEGRHGFATDPCLKLPEVITNLVEIFPTGTKYSVDLSEAIAEAQGETDKVEKYSVDKGAIIVKLKRMPSYKNIEIRHNKINKNKLKNLSQQRQKSKIKKTGKIRLVAGQKAKIKYVKKSKSLNIEIIEP